MGLKDYLATAIRSIEEGLVEGGVASNSTVTAQFDVNLNSAGEPTRGVTGGEFPACNIMFSVTFPAKTRS